MNPKRIDFLVDMAYGAMLLAAIIIIVTIGTQTGVAFGLGIIASYVIHVVWKMG